MEEKKLREIFEYVYKGEGPKRHVVGVLAAVELPNCQHFSVGVSLCSSTSRDEFDKKRGAAIALGRARRGSNVKFKCKEGKLYIDRDYPQSLRRKVLKFIEKVKTEIFKGRTYLNLGEVSCMRPLPKGNPEDAKVKSEV